MTEESVPQQDMNIIQPEVNPDEVAQAAALENQQAEAVPIDVQTEDDAQTGLVEDVDKAWDMAHAGKPERDEAAKLRRNANQLRALTQEAEELSATKMIDRSTEERFKHNAFNNKIDKVDIDDQLDLEALRNKSVDTERASRAKKRLENSASYRENEAAKRDERAKLREEWAAILHEHPVRDAYIENHPGIDFDARTMAEMSEMVEESLQNIAELEKAIDEADGRVGIFGLDDNFLQFTRHDRYGALEPLNVMKEAYGRNPGILGKDTVWGEEGRAAWKEYTEACQNPDTTLGQLKDIYVKAFTIAHINPIRSYSNSAKSVLEDIRSGRAS